MAMQNKRVVVLGGTSGIGLSVAAAVAKAGGQPVVVSRRAESVAAALATLGGSAEGITADLSSEAAIADLFTRIGAFDHLAYTAGEALMLSPLAEMDMGVARQFMETRFWGAMTAAKYAVPMIRPGGSITFTSGLAGDRPPGAGWSLGASICAAMDGLTRALALELAPLRVNLVSPGFVRTPLWRDIEEEAREALFASAGAKLLTGRVGESQEIAEAYLFLMQSGFTTGHKLVLDGGGQLV
jgi:NAD(P)-dependent dehydrogenase (short-subunit alcohol dehydrogenase family)